jgi:uncharacterized protein (TIGR02246 family)
VSNLTTAEAMIACYNAQNADAYVEFMTDDACEANYRGNVVRERKEGIHQGLKALFAEYPENRVEIQEKQVLGDYVILKESVYRGEKVGELVSLNASKFTVVAIYSFQDGKCSRVEFIR